jgi:hypothetical protein
MLCETCYWCATYLDKVKIVDKCPKCLMSVLSSFPILPDESFVFINDPKRGVELDFARRK